MGGKHMAFFDDLKRKVTETSQSAVKAAKEYAEEAKIKSQISTEQRNIQTTFTQLGKLFYEKHAADAASPFRELCVEVDSANERIAKLQHDLQFVKGVKRCTSCGADVPANSTFCGVCGASVETAPAPAQTQQQAAPAEMESCYYCGAPLEPGSTFCGACGKKQQTITFVGDE
jgi:hypothetical protein